MLRRLARPLLGVTFIAAGTDGLRDGDRRAQKAGALGLSDPRAMTRAVAGTQVGAGALLALGRFPRLSSLALAATVIPDALTGHAFWSEQDKQDRQAQRALFVRDLGLLGGLLVSVADTGGRESVPHRARRTARKASRKAAKQLP
ncbi:MAG: putative oxidoreductase [Frankiaceae bacterium]|nr:putative oxidoreductase [Frankiaceae bacterium]